jgi:hypothetical protein
VPLPPGSLSVVASAHTIWPSSSPAPPFSPNDLSIVAPDLDATDLNTHNTDSPTVPDHTAITPAIVVGSATVNPGTAGPSMNDLHAVNPTTTNPTTTNPTTANPTTINPTVVTPAIAPADVVSPATTGPGIVSPAATNPGVVNSTPPVAGVVNLTPPVPGIVGPTVTNPGVTDLAATVADPRHSLLASGITSPPTATTVIPPPLDHESGPVDLASVQAYPKFLGPEIIQHLSSISNVDGWLDLVQIYLKYKVASLTGGKGWCPDPVHHKYIARKWTKDLANTHPEYSKDIQNFPSHFN